MCECNPKIRTPFCGNGNCIWPHTKKKMNERCRCNGPYRKAVKEEVEKFKKHESGLWFCKVCSGYKISN